MPSVPVESGAGFYCQDGMGICAEVLNASLQHETDLAHARNETVKKFP